MSLSDLASLGSFISGLGVLLSLVFLYFQLRQVSAQVRLAERNQQAAIQQQRSATIADISIVSAAEPAFADAVAKGMAGSPDMSSTEINQFRAYAFARFALSEDAFLQHRNGLLTREAFDSFVAKFAQAFVSAGVRVMWKWARTGFSAEFAEFADGLVAQAADAPSLDDVARWRTDIADERATAV
jgi:hypothetical protein